MIEKPPHGSPCNGCGQCCEDELCALAALLYRRTEGPCPALTPQEDGPRGCGLVIDPKADFPAKVRRRGVFEMRRTAALLIGSGIGCDALLQGEAPSPEFYEKMLVKRAVLRPQIRQALIAWGVTNDV